jgi:gas vesicle protein
MAKTSLLKRIAIGAALAGAAGYVAGLITAPKSGRETRKDLAKKADTSRADIESQLRDMQAELGSILDDAKGKSGDLSSNAQKELKSLVEKAKDSKDKVRKVMNAVHDGDAKDKDLKKAIADAKHALEHIKDFIQK